MAAPRALVTGALGQDGSYLVELLVAKGYDVVGVGREPAAEAERVVASLRVEGPGRLSYRTLDVTDAAGVEDLVRDVAPDEVYHLAGFSHVGASFEEPRMALDVNGGAVVSLLEALRRHAPRARLFLAGSAEVFGDRGGAADEGTAFAPVSPYGAAKAYAATMVRIYRRAHGFHASVGIFFNHESERRPDRFVTRKVTRAFARLARSDGEPLRLGNLAARRDWGHAEDYVEAAWRMLQQDVPDDYVIATGVAHSVRDWVDAAARAAGFALDWTGEGLDAVGRDRATGRTLVTVDPRFYRPADVEALRGDPSKARHALGWAPRVGFDALVARMVAHDRAAS